MRVFRSCGAFANSGQADWIRSRLNWSILEMCLKEFSIYEADSRASIRAEFTSLVCRSKEDGFCVRVALMSDAVKNVSLMFSCSRLI